MSMDHMPAPGQIYKNTISQPLQIIAAAQHGVSGEPFIVYQALYGDFKTYVLTLDQFNMLINGTELPGNEKKIRQIQPNGSSESRYVSKEPDKCHDRRGIPPDDPDSFISAEDLLDKAAEYPSDYIGHQNWEEAGIVNPLLMQFLDAETYSDKCEVLEYIKKKVDDKLIESLAISVDVVLNEGSLEARFGELRTCLETFAKFENVRNN